MKQNIKLISPDQFDKYGIEKEYTINTCCDFIEQEGSDSKTIKSNDLKLEMRSKNPRAKSTGRVIRGFAGTIEKDRVDDIIPIDTFVKSRKDLLQPGASTMFLNHDTNIPIGIVSETAIDKNKGLFFEGFISKASDVDNIWQKAEEGILNSFSIRLRPKKVEVQEDGDGRVEAFIIKEMNLLEVSLVGIPANPGATVTEVISKSFDNAKEKYNNNINKGKESMDIDKSKLVNTSDMINKTVSDVFEAKMGEFLSKIGDAVDEKVKKSFEKYESSVKTDEKKVDEDIKKEDNSDVKEKECLINALSLLAEKIDSIGKNSEPTKKGVEQELEQVKKVNGSPKKSLVSLTDPDTVKYVLHLGQNEGEYKKLSDDDKEKARCFMFQAHVASCSK